MVQSKLDEMKRRLAERQKEILSRRNIADELAQKAEKEAKKRKQEYKDTLKRQLKPVTYEEEREETYDDYKSSTSTDRRRRPSMFGMFPALIGGAVVLLVGTTVFSTVNDVVQQSSVSNESISSIGFESFSIIKDAFSSGSLLAIMGLTAVVIIPFILLNLLRNMID